MNPDKLHLHLHLSKGTPVPELHLHLHMLEECNCAELPRGPHVHTRASYGELSIDCPGPGSRWDVDSNGRSCAHGSAIDSGQVADEVWGHLAAGPCGTLPTSGNIRANLNQNNGNWSLPLTGVQFDQYGSSAAANCLTVFATFAGRPTVRTSVTFNGLLCTDRHCDGTNPDKGCPGKVAIAPKWGVPKLLAELYELTLQQGGRTSARGTELLSKLSDKRVVLTFDPHDAETTALWRGDLKLLGRFTLEVKDDAGYHTARLTLDLQGPTKRIVWGTERFLPDGESELQPVEAGARKYPNLMIRPVS